MASANRNWFTWNLLTGFPNTIRSRAYATVCFQRWRDPAFALSKARGFAWQLAKGLATAEGPARTALIDATDHGIAALGRRIRSPRWLLRPVLAAVRARESNDTVHVIDVLAGGPPG